MLDFYWLLNKLFLKLCSFGLNFVLFRVKDALQSRLFNLLGFLDGLGFFLGELSNFLRRLLRVLVLLFISFAWIERLVRLLNLITWVHLITFFASCWPLAVFLYFELETDLLLLGSLSSLCLSLGFIFIFVCIDLALSFGFLNDRELLFSLEI